MDTNDFAQIAIAPIRKKATIDTFVPDAGYLPNNLVFASDSGFYFKTFAALRPIRQAVSTMYPRISSGSCPYFRTSLKRIVSHSALAANGYGRRSSVKTTSIAFDLEGPMQIASIGTTIPYHFTGAAPDSIRLNSRRKCLRGGVRTGPRPDLQSQRHTDRADPSAGPR
jgi:lactonase